MQRRILKMRADLDKLEMELGPKNRKSLARIEDSVKHLAVFSGAKDGSDDLSPYISYLLHGRTSEQIICDVTPSYSMLSAERYAEMASIGRAKFLFIMRDPISRLWSQIRIRIRRLAYERNNKEFNT